MSATMRPCAAWRKGRQAWGCSGRCARSPTTAKTRVRRTPGRVARRFVDRRTSVLMRRLRDKEEIVAEIGADGAILVEDHYVGRLDGFRFTPDASSAGIHGRAA